MRDDDSRPMDRLQVTPINKEKPGLIVHAYDASTGGTGAGRSGALTSKSTWVT